MQTKLKFKRQLKNGGKALSEKSGIQRLAPSYIVKFPKLKIKTTMLSLFMVLFKIKNSLADPTSYDRALTAVSDLKGFKCMQLRLDLIERDAEISIVEHPWKGARWILSASSLVIAKDPIEEVNGYIHILGYNGRLGWIEARFVRPWRVAGEPNAKCTPHMMSDGYPGR